jgi:hypothetical protein
MPPIPPKCQSLANKVDALYVELEALQKSLHLGDGINDGIVQEMAALGRSIGAAQANLNQCLVENPQPPGPQPFNTSLSGHILINVGLPASLGGGGATSGFQVFSMSIVVEPSRTVFSVLSTSPLPSVPSFTALLGLVNGSTVPSLTINPQTAGFLTPETGPPPTTDMLIDSFLELDTTINVLGIITEPYDTSVAEVHLGTSSSVAITSPSGAALPGSQIDGAGDVSLVGVSTFSSGKLTGLPAAVGVFGKLAPWPPPN